jgi:arylsulfatase A-like enzyme
MTLRSQRHGTARKRPRTRRAGGWTVCALASAALAGCTPQERLPSGPNLLLITIDTLRADRLGHYGYERPTSPELDALAATSVVFDSAIAASPWTLPSFASIMTSALPATHGVTTYDSALAPSFPTLAETLRDAGYDTSAVACHIYQGSRHGLHKGFVHFDEELIDTESNWSFAQSAEPVSDRGIAWIEAKAAARDALGDERPWFLWLHYFDVHDRYLPHDDFAELGQEEESELYDGEIAYTDRAIGRVLAALRAAGFESDTVVAMVADHGEEFHDHGKKLHGHTVYQELVRVPLLIRAPGVAASRVSEPVHHVDLVPTFCQLLDVAPRGPQAGRSLVPLMRGGTGTPRALVTQLSNSPHFEMDAVLHEGWKLIVHREKQSGAETLELYELATDPGEQQNRVDEEPERVATLRALLDERIAAAAALGERYGGALSIGLSPSEQSHLGDLGYTGEGTLNEDEAGSQ